MSQPEGGPAGGIPEKAFTNPEAFVQRKLAEFHARQPKFPADPKEQERRIGLLRIDPLYQKLKADHDAASGQTRLNLGLEQSNRLWDVLTNPNPELLISQAQEEQNRPH